MKSLLGELDDELMLELDEIVRQNQLNCLPVSKRSSAEAELLENHPELVERLEHSKSVKVDAVSLHSRLYERESRYHGGAARAKVDLLEDFAPNASIQKDQRRRASKEHSGPPKSPSLSAQSNTVLATSRSPTLPPTTSPVLTARKSTVDLMFDMDDYDGGEGAFQSARRQHRQIAHSPRLPALSPGLDEEAFPPIGLSQSPGAAAGLAISAKSPASYEASSGFRAHHRRPILGDPKPWASSMSSSSKLEMDGNIAQNPSSRIAGISSSSTPSKYQTDSLSGSLPTRMSQKERKRQQQQQQQQQQHSQLPVEILPSSPDVGARWPGQKTPASPWQVASKGPKVNLKDVLETADPSPAATKTAVERTPSPMTLRQTVSGKRTPTQRSISGPADSSHPTLQQRPPSSKTTTPPPSRSLSTTTRTNPTDFPPIQSIRHNPPAPAEPTLQLSMADILAQQNREKEIIKEAAAKRSLQEIQEEQAFQEWWDLESRKAREAAEEAAAVRRPGGGGRGGAGKERRGRSRSERGGRGGGGGVKGKGREGEVSGAGAGEGSKPR